MKTVYSIIYLSIRPNVKEQVSIGLIVSNPHSTKIRYSERKLSYVKNLIDVASFSLATEYLKGLRSSNEINLIDLFSQKNLQYLSKYNNNIVTFSPPEEIELELNDDIFEKLFTRFVFTEINEIAVQSEPEHRVKVVAKEWLPTVKEFVNTKITLTSKNTPSLLIPEAKIDFIGKNDVPVLGQFIDFESNNHISKAFTVLTSVITSLVEDGKNQGKYYLLGDEPNKMNFKSQHDLWNKYRNLHFIEYIPLDETQKVTEYFQKHNVRPFID